MTENVNQKRLFIAACLALLVTAITFAIRAGLTTFAFSASFGEPCLQRLLRAAGKSI